MPVTVDREFCICVYKRAERDTARLSNICIQGRGESRGEVTGSGRGQ